METYPSTSLIGDYPTDDSRSPFDGSISTSLGGLSIRRAPPFPLLKYTASESQEAHEQWKANCGPHAIAAACGRTLQEVRAAIPNFRGWMNPTQVEQTLINLGQRFVLQRGLKTLELCTGINRVQWEGPWLNPGVPPSEAYKYTHWISHFTDPKSRGGWVLCTAINPYGWLHISEWIQQTIEREGGWHITHHYRFPTR